MTRPRSRSTAGWLGSPASSISPATGIHYEPRWFRPWPRGARRRGRLRAAEYADRRPSVRPGAACGSVSRSAKTPGRPTGPGRPSRPAGVDLILNPSASHFAFGKEEIRRRFVLEGSRAFAAAYVYANLVGNEAGRSIYDGSVLIAAGRADARGGPAVFVRRPALHDGGARSRLAPPAQARLATDAADPEDLVTVGSRRRSVRDTGRRPADARAGLGAGRTSRRRSFPGPWHSGCSTTPARATRGVSSCRPAAEPTRRRSPAWWRSPCRLAADELGVAEAAPGWACSRRQRVTADRRPRRWWRRLLTCVYQAHGQLRADHPGRGAGSWPMALGGGLPRIRRGAGGSGLRADRVGGASAGRSAGRPTTWPLQNIQARARAPGCGCSPTSPGALLVSTSNRSEAAVGYATMDGDTCGGIAPIAGIDKAYLRRWLVWLEQQGPAGIGPLPALAAVNAQQPTAELRPAGGRPDRRGRSHALRRARRDRAGGHSRPAHAARVLAAGRAASSAATPRPTGRVGRAVLHALEPQPVEAGAVRPVVPPRRREPRSQDLVPVSDPLRAASPRARGAAGRGER